MKNDGEGQPFSQEHSCVDFSEALGAEATKKKKNGWSQENITK